MPWRSSRLVAWATHGRRLGEGNAKSEGKKDPFLRAGRERGVRFPLEMGEGSRPPGEGRGERGGYDSPSNGLRGKRDPFVRGSREEGVPMPGPWGDGKETPSARGWSGSGGGIPDVDQDGDSNPLL